jgi:hypothetical protein
MQKVLSHRGLGARAQRESCGLDRRVARRQLCKRLDCATASRGSHDLCVSACDVHTPATLGKHHPTLGWHHATVKQAVFSICPIEDLWEKLEYIFHLYPCGGGVEYLHRDPANSRRRRKGKSQIGDSKRWSRVPKDLDPKMTALARPATYTKDRPVLSSERAHHKNKTVTVKQQ